MNSLAIMQPYFFPYLGYFQMIHAVDKFVFYDDVSFINRGWINRNRILVNNNPSYITVQLRKASQNRLINEIEIGDNLQKIAKTIQLAYKKAPQFDEVWPLIEATLNEDVQFISELAIHSVQNISRFLGLETDFENSGTAYRDTKEMDRAEDRLIEICKRNQASQYINAIGGIELYNKDYFSKQNITLQFIKCNLTPYKQFNNDFVSGLSIIDVMMFNDIESCKEMLNKFELI